MGTDGEAVMAVAHSQIAEVYSAICNYVHRADVPHLLDDLKLTAAYERNQSFRDTIDRLQQHVDMLKALVTEPK